MDKLNLALIAGMVMVICGMLVYSSASIVKAEPTSTAIEIRAQDYTTAVTSITFPQAEPGTTVSDPRNSEGETQTFGGAGTAKPVVTLVNTSANTYTIWYNITAWTPADVVTSESYVILAKGAACADETVIANTVTFGADTVSVGPTTIAATGDGGSNDEKDLYLKVILGAAYGKSGTSTLTILGEI